MSEYLEKLKLSKLKLSEKHYLNIIDKRDNLELDLILNIVNADANYIFGSSCFIKINNIRLFDLLVSDDFNINDIETQCFLIQQKIINSYKNAIKNNIPEHISNLEEFLLRPNAQ